MSIRDSVIIEVDDLKELLDSDERTVKLVDGTYGVSPYGMPALHGYQTGHISNAVYFDIDAIADHEHEQPHMLPSKELFDRTMSDMGIGNDDIVVVYDQGGVYMAASRVWWMFKYFGHKDVRILNGGLPYWRARGFEVNDGISQVKPSEYNSAPQEWRVVSMDDVIDLLGSETAIVDARAQERFDGLVEEPRAGMRKGHIPGASCIPFMKLLDGQDGRFVAAETIEEVAGHLTNEDRIISSCGSGVTACILAVALASIGHDKVSVYDGSWSEWGLDIRQTPVEV